ncbi:Cobra-like protein [Thalictrum thalictroides]|uniref:Cobra-like protein n=1 Tax=Thalictrum thalictroides TaxID=46969 RepID=A0A7J6WRU9_THATH|nr:Cobra-like protein [Thalictrum thalictroides]
MKPIIIFFSIFLLLLDLPISISQEPAPAPIPPSSLCNGIFLSYSYTTGKQLPPHAQNPLNQGYRFESILTILNNDIDELKSWKIFVGFQHNELLVSASNAILADGTSIPTLVGNGTVFAGYPNTDLKSAIQTAGDENQMGVQIPLLGTQFGVNIINGSSSPMPTNISLAMDGFSCPKPTMQGKNVMNVCCVKDPNFKLNVTVEEFLPRQNGDLTIDYDVLRSLDNEYDAKVTIANHNPLGRLDYWRLSWDWMREEFILNMQGAHTSVGNPNNCIFGRQAEYYKDMDFSTVLSCEKRPTIVDLPRSRANDSIVGRIPFCCRNGTILPTSMDSSKSISAFQLLVKKMPPDLNKTHLIPPQNWQINGTLNPDYECGPPLRVNPSQFADPSGLPFNRTAVASWQVVCNITQPKESKPRCCVSFSAYYNESVIPCPTCACGCPRNPSQTCSATAPAVLLPPNAALVPFDNRTLKTQEWARLKRQSIPDPMPCGDNCGVSINWHVQSDYSRGWSARITLFNWGETDFADWFTAVQFKKATPGFEAVYSFNGSASLDDNTTIFMQGLEGLNYLMAEQDGANPSKDPRVPGKQQSVISFKKKQTPGINIVAGDGYPSKVIFNGEECSLPTIFPSSSVRNDAAMSIWSILIALIVLVLTQQ